MRRIDSHTHVDAGRPEVLLARAREQFGYEKIGVMGIPCSNGPLNNLECLRVKALAPDYAYVYGGMVYSGLSKPDARDHEKQLMLLMDAGFDTFVEVGPGKTLTGLIGKIGGAKIAQPVDNPEALAALKAQL